MTQDLIFTTDYINANWRMKVYGVNEQGERINSLLGVDGLLNLIGVEFFNKFLNKADRSMEDKSVFKLRRGLKVSFYVK